MFYYCSDIIGYLLFILKISDASLLTSLAMDGSLDVFYLQYPFKYKEMAPSLWLGK